MSRSTPVLVSVLLLVPIAVLAPVAAGEAVLVGAAGEWVFVYVPLATPAQDMSWEHQLVATVAGAEGAAYLALTPTAVAQRASGTELVFSDPHARAVGTQGAVFEEHSWVGVGASGLAGIVYAFGASAPWALDMRIEGRDGTAFLEPILLRGSGAVFALGAEATPFAGVSLLSASWTTPGWSHLQSDAEHVQPPGVRRLDASFPAGDVSSTSATVGAATPLGGQAFTLNEAGGAGMFLDTAGDFEARIAYAEATLGVRPLVAHIPVDVVAVLPDFAAGAYTVGDWSFDRADPLTALPIA